MWYRALSLLNACTQSSGIILNPKASFMLNFVSFVASIAELAHGEKSHTQSLTHSDNHSFNHPAYLMPGTAFASEKNKKNHFLSHSLGDLGVMYILHLQLVGKPLVNFLFVITELFSLSLRRELRRYKRKSVKVSIFRKGVGY